MLSSRVRQGRPMFKEGLHLPSRSALGHVSAHSPHRIRRYLLALLTLTFFVVGFSARAETAGDAGQTVKETDLFEKPSAKATSMGRLPKGSIITQKGEKKGRFYR